MRTNRPKKGIGIKKVVLLLTTAAAVACYPLLLNFAKNALAAYLIVNKPVSDARVLIVEGWIFGNLIPDVKFEFLKGRYDYLLVAWQPKTAESNDLLKPDGEGERVDTREKLIAAGLDSSKIRVVSLPQIAVHNTLAMALTVGKWLRANDPAATRVNVCTANVHGRKTWVAYKRALGGSGSVGIISFTRRNIPVLKWWKKSPGGGMRFLLRRWAGVIDAAWCPISWVDSESRP
jgi:hypothetical protein